MTTELGLAPTRAAEAAASPVRPFGAWVGPTIVSTFWVHCAVTDRMELPSFGRFLSQMAVEGAMLLAFLGWWLSRKHLRWPSRLAPLLALGLGGAVLVLVSHPSMPPMLITRGLPSALTAWAGVLLVTTKFPSSRRIAAACAAILVTSGIFTLLRFDGLRGSGSMEASWRWSESAEDRLLARQTTAATTSATPATAPDAVTLSDGDWPGFRGAHRNAVVVGAKIRTDWTALPPKLLWRERVGPAWSSMIVAGGRLYTQEQHGPQEAVVCRDASSGSKLWTHADPARFYEPLAGAGPRATPTFAGGRVYVLGATGILNALDAATGRRIWSRDLAVDAGAKPPIWGFASSPLVSDGKVIVFAGGEGEKTLLAYDNESGTPTWGVPAGNASYVSAQLASITDETQVLMVSDRGVMGFNPADGAKRWEFASQLDAPRSIQPFMAGADQLLVGMGMDQETTLLKIASAEGGTARVHKLWSSRFLKSSFNDLVMHQGYVYGFDGSIFGCIDLKDGGRRWKKGRYGCGQVILFADQSLLLVLSEEGEVILLAADPKEHRELGRFQAINGKTWNHPASAHGRLYVRNSEEMACYELGVGG